MTSFAVAVVVPIAYGNSPYNQLVLELIGIYAIAALGLTVAIGLTAQFQMAQVGCMAVSAYASSVLAVRESINAWESLAIGVGLSLGLGCIIGLICMRTRTHYLLLVTFAAQIILVDVIKNVASITGGVNGQQGIMLLPFVRGDLVSATVGFSILVLCCTAVGYLVAVWLSQSFLGLGMQSTRQSESATVASGLSVPWHRFLAVVASAVYGGVAGAVVGPVLTNLVPESFGLDITLLLLVIVVAGGMASPLGTIVAAVLITWANQAAEGRTNASPLVYGLLVMVILVVAPGGLGGAAGRLSRAISRKFAARRPAVRVTSLAGEEAQHESGRRGAVQPLGDIGRRPEGHAALLYEGRRGGGVGASLSLEGVVRRFGGVTAVNDVALDVSPGEIHALIGPNGSGKTTLLNIISGFVRQDSGVIVVGGQTVGSWPVRRRAAAGVGRTFQHPVLLDEDTVLANVTVGAVKGMSGYARLARVGSRAMQPARAESLARGALELVGMECKADVRAGGLPYGERRLVDLARMLAGTPRLVLLDEPTSGVGARSIEVVQRVIRWLAARGVTVLLVEHNMELVNEMCDNATVLRAGEVISHGAVEDVMADAVVVEAYLGDSDA